MISYPVDVQGTRWSVYRISTATIVKHAERWPRADGGPIERLDSDLVPLLEVQTAQPAYNPATHKLEAAAPVTNVAANTHTHGWTIVALSQAELDAIAERDGAKAAYVALKAHTGTTAERLTRLENVLAYLLKDQYGAQ